METEPDFAFAADRYASETEQRMAQIVRELGVSSGGTDDVVRQLREQEESSRRMGFVGIARLCGAMDDYLAEIGRGEPPRLSEAAPILREICRLVRLHAKEIATGSIDHPVDRTCDPDKRG